MSYICYTYVAISLIALWSSLIVISALDPIHRTALQIVVFQAGAFMYTIQDFYFLGQTYIIVYVGAIAILFLFVIMMIQINETKTAYISSSSSSYLFLLQTQICIAYLFNTNESSIVTYFYPTYSISYDYLTDIKTQAYMTYVGYPLAIIQIGLGLWVVMIGIIAITN